MVATTEGLQITCKVCDQGLLERKRTYRMSRIVVVIGYILLIPCFVGLLGAGRMLMSVREDVTRREEARRNDIAKRMDDAGVGNGTVMAVMAGRPLPTDEPMTSAQREAVQTAKYYLTLDAPSGVGFLLASGGALAVAVVSLVSGLLGWLLVTKKTILQCSRCGAVVAAS